MNKYRRKRLSEAYEMVETAKAILEEVRDDESNSYENLPENFQDSDRGEKMQDYIDMLEEAYDHLDDVSSMIGQI